jgi:hypothetical protein
MAAFNRPTEATYAVHENVTVDTTDNEDHTFCSVLFPVKCKDLLPLDHLIIKTIAVRDGLGPLTVWVSNEDEGNGDNQVRLNPAYWTKLLREDASCFQAFLQDVFFGQTNQAFTWSG